MIKKEYRFHGHGSVKYVYRKGASVRGDAISLKVLPTKNRENARFAVVVSKKVSKSAPKRNRIRRRLYEIVRNNWEKIAPADIVITVFDESIAKTKASELEASLLELFSRGKLLK